MAEPGSISMQMPERPLVIATGNRGKVLEFQSLLAPAQFSLLTPKEIGFTQEIEEVGQTFAQNALIKAQALAALTAHPVLADDSGLEVEALMGAPGVFSARYCTEVILSKSTGAPLPQDAANRIKLLTALRGEKNRQARFQCVLCYLVPGQAPQYFSGKCEGRIGEIEAGEGGFGYDPLFIPEGYNLSFGELSAEIKDSMSHRARAAALFLSSLRAT